MSQGKSLPLVQTSRPAIWTIRSHIELVPGSLSSGVNRPRRESEHKFVHSVEVPPLLIRLSGMTPNKTQGNL